MKKVLTGSLLIVMVLGCSFHFGMMYFNYIRTLGLGFTPPGITIIKPDNLSVIRKDIFQAKW